MLAVSPKISEFLLKATKTSDIETALWKVVSEYLDLKIRPQQMWG